MSKKINWEKFIFLKQDLLTSGVEATCYKKYHRALLGVHMDYAFKYVDKYFFYSSDDRLKVQQYIKRNPKKIIRQFLNVVKLESERYVKVTKAYSKIDFTDKSKTELKKLFNDFVESYKRVYSLIMVPMEMEPIITELIEGKLAERINPQQDYVKFRQVFNNLSVPSRESDTIKEKKDLLKISIAINKNKFLRDLFLKNDNREIIKKLKEKDNSIFQKIINHQNRYVWSDSFLLTIRPLSMEDFLGRIKENLKNQPAAMLKKLEKAKRSGEINFIKATKEIKPDKDFKELIRLMREIIYIRTYRIERLNQGCFYCRPLLKEIARRLKIDYEDLIYLLPLEIEEFFRSGKKINKKITKARRQGYGMINRPKIKIFIGRELKKLKKELSESNKEAAASGTITGQVANRGRAKGKVKLIFEQSELSKINKGDILVAEMTTPNYITGMQKAAAVITDIGGITSHAAIISRELGIPCLIGTKIATKVLKDGDLVEVDANHGVVKILKK